MSDALPPKPRVNAKWRSQPSAPGAEKRTGRFGKLILLGAALAVVAGLVVGLLLLLGKDVPPPPLLAYAVVGEYYERPGAPTLMPTPWFFDDAALLDSVPGHFPGTPKIEVATNKNLTISQTKGGLLASLEKASKAGRPPQEGESGLGRVVILYVAALGVVTPDGPTLLPNDWTFESEAPAGKDDIPAKGITVEEILAPIRESSAKRVVLLLNWSSPRSLGPPLCRSGEGRPFSAEVDKLLTQLEKDGKLPCPVITACSPQEESLPLAVEGRSVFGYYVAQGLGGRAAQANGVPTTDLHLSQLADYLRTRVNRWALENTGRTQQPKAYGLRDLILLSDLPQPGTAQDGVEHEKQEEKAGPSAKAPTKEAHEADLAKRRSAVEALLGGEFPSWNQGWSLCCEWGSPFDPVTPAHDSSAKELAAPVIRRLAQTLRRYEELVLQYHGKSGGQSPGYPMMVPPRDKVRKASEDAAALLAGLSDLAVPHEGSLAALWPLEEPPVKELRKYRDQLVTAGTPGSPFKLDEFLKDAKAHRKEAIFLCWKSLVEEGELTKEKLKVVLDGLTLLLQEERPGGSCVELNLLRRLNDYVEAPNYSPGEPYGLIVLDTLRVWLRAEHAAERVPQAWLPAGRLCAARKQALEAIDNDYRSTCAALWHQTKPRRIQIKEPNYVRLKEREVEKAREELKAVLKRYENLHEQIVAEHEAHEACWESVDQLLACAALARAGGEDEAWLAWANATLQLAGLIKDETLFLSPTPQTLQKVRSVIDSVRRARRTYLDGSDQISRLQKLLKSFETPGGETPVPEAATLLDTQHALSAEFLTPDKRIELIATLLASQTRLHEQTLRQKAVATPTPPIPPARTTSVDMPQRVRELEQLAGIAYAAPDDRAVSEQVARHRKATEQLVKWLAARQLEREKFRSAIDGAPK